MLQSSGSVPDEVVNCVTQGIDSCWHVLKKNIEQFHFQRAERAAKYMTYPQVFILFYLRQNITTRIAVGRLQDIDVLPGPHALGGAA